MSGPPINTSRSGVPPEGYKRIPAGHKCRCVNLWRDATGDYWCCNAQPLVPPEANPTLPEPQTEAPEAEPPSQFDAAVALVQKAPPGVRVEVRLVPTSHGALVITEIVLTPSAQGEPP